MHSLHRNKLIQQAKQLGELSQSLLTAAYTGDASMLHRVAAALSSADLEVKIVYSAIREAERWRSHTPEPEPPPKPDPVSSGSFHTDHDMLDELLKKMRERMRQKAERDAAGAESFREARARQQRDWWRSQTPRPAPPQGSGETSIRRLVDILGVHYTAGMTTEEMVRTAQRTTHPDAPGGSAELFKEVTTIAQVLGVLDRRGQRVG